MSRPVLSLCRLFCLLLAFFAVAVLPAEAEEYHAGLLYLHRDGSTHAMGQVWMKEEKGAALKVRVDFQLGAAGAFSAFYLPEKKSLHIVSHALSAYIELPVTGRETRLEELLPSVVKAFMPFGVPALQVKEKRRAVLPSASCAGYACHREKTDYELWFMGGASSVVLAQWYSDSLPFLPLRVDELQGWEASPEQPRGSVRLDRVLHGKLGLEDRDFERPEHYSRYSSALNMLLYALAA